MYSTILSDPEVQGKVLDLSGIHDYAYVLLGEVNEIIFRILLKALFYMFRNQLVVPIEVMIRLSN